MPSGSGKHCAVRAAWRGRIEGVVRGFATETAPARVNAVNPGSPHAGSVESLPEDQEEEDLEWYFAGA